MNASISTLLPPALLSRITHIIYFTIILLLVSFLFIQLKNDCPLMQDFGIPDDKKIYYIKIYGTK